MSQAVQEILQRIDSLSPQERLELDEQLARQAEAEWRKEAEAARLVARQRGIDQAAIDRAVEQVRYGP
jgi:hypothetical protein